MRSHPASGLLLVVAAWLLLGACTDQEADGAGPAEQLTSTTVASAASPSTTNGATMAPRELPSAISCTTQYRPEASSLEGAESPILHVERSDELIASPVTHQFATMTLEVRFAGDSPEGHIAALRVTTPEGTQLWQGAWYFYARNGEELGVDFGSHGFTGLHYIDHAGSSLQVMCDAG